MKEGKKKGRNPSYLLTRRKSSFHREKFPLDKYPRICETSIHEGKISKDFLAIFLRGLDEIHFVVNERAR